MKKRNPLLFIFGISALFFAVFLVVIVKTLTFSPSVKNTPTFFSAKTDSIGILEVKGVIMDSKKYLEAIAAFEEEPTIKGVIVRINSPGGGVAPSQEVYDGLKRLSAKKPVYTSMSSVAASGGYYIASGTQKIFANPGTITGSIGVIMPFADMSGLYQWAKIKPYSIKTGKYKDLGSPAREMTSDEKRILQEMIDNVLSQFRKAVAQGRKLSMNQVVSLSDGRIFSGEQAKGLKLVDELGGLFEAVDAMAKQVGIEGKPKLVYSTKKKKLLERLFEEDFEGESSSSSSVLLNLSALVKLFSMGSKLSNIEAQSQQQNFGAPLFLLPNSLVQPK